MTLLLKKQVGTKVITETVENEEVTREEPDFETIFSMEVKEPTAHQRMNKRKMREERLHPGTYKIEKVE